MNWSISQYILEITEEIEAEKIKELLHKKAICVG